MSMVFVTNEHLLLKKIYFEVLQDLLNVFR